MAFNQKDNFRVISTTQKSDNNSSSSNSVVEKKTVQILENKNSIPFRQINTNERITNENTRNIYYQTTVTRQIVTTENPNFLNDFKNNFNLGSNTVTLSRLTGVNKESHTSYPKSTNGAVPKQKKTVYESDKLINNNYMSPIIDRHKPISLSNIRQGNNQLRSNFFNDITQNGSIPSNQLKLNNVSYPKIDLKKNEKTSILSGPFRKGNLYESPNNANNIVIKKPISSNIVNPPNRIKLNSSNIELKSNKNEGSKYIFPKPKLGPGKLFIFHNYKFDDSSNNREGSKADVELLRSTFKNFKINTEEYNNLTVKKVREKAEKISNQNFSQNSAIFIVILSHGGGMDMIDAYDNKYSINDDLLIPILSNRTLKGKPKIFIVQACKGGIDLRDYQTDGSPNSKYLTPDEIFKFYSTTEGFVAFRDVKTGSVFIKAFCAELSKSGTDKCIKTIMENVINIVKDKTHGKQIPSMCVNNTAPYVLGQYI